MKHFEDFERSGISFEDRDHPSALCSAVGRAAIAHVTLEWRVAARARVLAKQQGQVPCRMPDDWSLARKLKVLDDLIASSGRRWRFNVGDHHASEVRAELLHMLKSADRLYRRAVVPGLLGPHLRDEYSADLPAGIMDVADYLMMAREDLEGFFLEAEPVL